MVLRLGVLHSNKGTTMYSIVRIFNVLMHATCIRDTYLYIKYANEVCVHKNKVKFIMNW